MQDYLEENNNKRSPKDKSLTRSQMVAMSLKVPDFDQKTPLSKDELYATCKAYFQEHITKNTIPSMTGLAKVLGVTRHELLSAKSNDSDIQRIISLSIQTVVEHVEQMLLSGRPPIGLIFWLKNNADWIDKTTTEHTEKSISEILSDLEREGKVINANNPLSKMDYHEVIDTMSVQQ